MADEEELDYMSEVFVKEAAAKPPKKEIKRLQGRKSKATAKNVLERCNREEGLATPIPIDNKGFRLLSKMGYVPGESLGKSGVTSLNEPIPVVLKEGRLGLGRDSYVKEKEERKESLEKERLEMFHDHRRGIALKRRLKIDLKQSKRACHQLDTTNGHTEPISSWYWDEIVEEKEEEEEEALVPSDEEQLTILTDYLRNEYYYCLWCGTNYSSEEDLLNNCPGNTWLEHQS